MQIDNLKMGLHAEMPHHYDWKSTKKCKNCWWIILLIAGFLILVNIVVFFFISDNLSLTAIKRLIKT
jgi:hypothetical protein